MIATKIFNNNALSTVTDDGKDAILLGLGIGFNKRPGDEINEDKIEKIYYVQDNMQTKFLELLKNVSPEVMDASQKIISLIPGNEGKFNNKGILSLIEHISFAIERTEKNVFLPNLMLSDIKIMYPEEFELGTKALDIIDEICHICLPKDEAGYIALHFVNMQANNNLAYDTLKFVKGNIDLIKECYGIELDESNLNTIRFMTHLKFLAQRIFKNETYQDDKMIEMYDYLINNHPKNVEYLEKLNEYTEKEFKYKLDKPEKIYLLLHLTKIL
ncbi:PRD domain-containing protein [Terrisporobacter mayombei]|nr:PRD domain-containing protein [Terrisporobacter mayombei]